MYARVLPCKHYKPLLEILVAYTLHITFQERDFYNHSIYLIGNTQTTQQWHPTAVEVQATTKPSSARMRRSTTTSNAASPQQRKPASTTSRLISPNEPKRNTLTLAVEARETTIRRETW